MSNTEMIRSISIDIQGKIYSIIINQTNLDIKNRMETTIFDSTWDLELILNPKTLKFL